MTRQKSTLLIGAYCKQFRINVLQLTLKEVEGNENIKTLSSFENGRSTNINHLLKYVEKCDSKFMRFEFLNGLVNVLERDINE